MRISSNFLFRFIYIGDLSVNESTYEFSATYLDRKKHEMYSVISSNSC